MKIDRLIGILSTLLQTERVTAPYLAEKFEVSRRTINRDIEDLCKAGIPLVTIQGIGGGISIADGYKLDKTIFTTKEMQGILAGLQSLDSVSGHHVYKQLMEKLDGNGKRELEETCYDSSGHILINLSSHYKDSLAPKIDQIRTAIEQKRLISFEYYYTKGKSIRQIEPYLLVFEWSSWYVWGYCLDRNQFRMFKLNRILHLTIDQETYMLRPMPSFGKHIDQYFTKQIHLEALFQPAVKWRLIEEYGSECYKELNTGELLLEMDFTNKENMITWLLGFGNQVKIIKPDHIRKEFIELIEQMRNIYKET